MDGHRYRSSRPNIGELLNDRVVWLGGSPCSGKSTVAALLAYGRRAAVYSCDDAFDRHAGAVSAAAAPTLKKVTRIGVAQRFAICQVKRDTGVEFIRVGRVGVG